MSNKAEANNMKDDRNRELTPKLRFPEFRNADGWKNKLLGPYLEDCSTRVQSDTKLPVYSSTREGLKRQDAYFDGRVLLNENEYGVVPHGCFVYRHMSDDGLFKFNINETGGDIAVSKEYPVFRTKDLSSIFLLNKLNEGPDFKQFALSQKAGGTRTRLYFSKLCEWKTLLPSLPEQQKIAECLTSLDEVIDAHRQKLDTLKDHKYGLMQQFLPYEGETQPRLRFPEFRNAGEWAEETFGKIIKINSGKGFKASDYSKTGIRLLQIENVGYGVTKWNENTIYLPEASTAEYPELVLRNGDVVLALNRPVTNDELKIAKLQKDDEPSILYQRVGKIELLGDSLRVDFAFHICRQFIKQFVTNKSIGSDQPFISLKDLYAQTIFIPLPSEQQKIADCLSCIDELITAQTEKLEALKTHKQGLMQQLFPSTAEVEA
jgi:type I restriction enzyme S subunit